MAFQDLREFIRALEKSGQLNRIRAEVDPELEITEITDRVSKRGGPALFFENVRGHSMPVLINAMGSRERMKLALGVMITRDDCRADTRADRREISSGADREDQDGAAPGRHRKDVSKGRARRPVQRAHIAARASSHCSIFRSSSAGPKTAGAYITLPLVFTKNPETGQAQLRDVSHAGLRRNDHRDALADSQARRAALSQSAPRRREAGLT